MPDQISNLLKKSMFISQKYEQQGLKFQSTKALFNMVEGVIYCEEVPYIDVADSRVFPFENKVVIEEDAVMRRLENATMWASRDNKYHELFNGSLNIFWEDILLAEKPITFIRTNI